MLILCYITLSRVGVLAPSHNSEESEESEELLSKALVT